MRYAVQPAGRGRRGPVPTLVVEQVSKSSTVDIGVFAHDEVKNIRNVLRSLMATQAGSGARRRISVFSSSKDGTNEAVEELAHADRRVRLVREQTRQGKAASINLFLQSSAADICVVVSADVVPDEEAVDALVGALSNPTVGLAGATVIPTNPADTFFGFVSHLLWRLHGRFGKVGEMIAFKRGLVPSITGTTSVDEAFVQAAVGNKGMKTACVPDAVVWNGGPDNIVDFMRQRSRIFSGHVKLALQFGAKMPTMDSGFVKNAAGFAVQESGKIRRRAGFSVWKGAVWLALAATLEVLARFYGIVSLALKGEDTVWKQVRSGRAPLGTNGSDPVGAA
ncbi:MAG: glycosyltransferase [Nitrososphaerota archaeon]|nr:glycosyltransferase [Nitrososphaerota archaeon]